ncbi:hypothetical protein [Corynebacterium nasicanis]|uniref:Uncharacterized protein n=1 Tax=Corynebacterium nasicanis TaxID=1448267 RepID=A0ABW1QC75_9CORY
MKYQGDRIDELIAGGLGRLPAQDGMQLNTAPFPLPVPLGPARLVPVSARHGITPDQARPRGLVAHDAASHPRTMQYRADARTRIIAHLREHPTWIASHFSAAALLGITDFADGADAFVLNRNKLHLTDDLRVPSQHQVRSCLSTWSIGLAEHTLLVTPPMLTLAHCLRAVFGEEHRWHTPPGLAVDAPMVRAVQIIDRFRREFHLTPEHLREGLRGLVNGRTVERLVRLSDDGADSPPETLIRLIARDCAPEYQWQSQVPVYTDGTVGEPGVDDTSRTLLTVLDLADVAARRYLYYDGDHHLLRERRDQDSTITAHLTSWSWTGLRITAGMVADPASLASHIRALASAPARAA